MDIIAPTALLTPLKVRESYDIYSLRMKFAFNNEFGGDIVIGFIRLNKMIGFINFYKFNY